ncbi:uncharacterized protein EI90DRAFT_3196660 [Cantharellus anzutake]|uniref:uncharacterized protein n=1 Tax=Cantharellus anzutake TaxID=1750568 RepID=UPI001906AAA8|nr:uncharacterized protein EI90DRAFT_3196660 [Cantharellus anzutake]KAF8331671.1 hypothetical protein EI90DRAFT_3196660 [Cantharellus anzutake]
MHTILCTSEKPKSLAASIVHGDSSSTDDRDNTALSNSVSLSLALEEVLWSQLSTSASVERIAGLQMMWVLSLGRRWGGRGEIHGPKVFRLTRCCFLMWKCIPMDTRRYVRLNSPLSQDVFGAVIWTDIWRFRQQIITTQYIRATSNNDGNALKNLSIQTRYGGGGGLGY